MPDPQQTTIATDFASLDLRTELVAELGKLGYEEPTPIQAQAIPLLLAGHDLIGQAATGTGKTAAFGLPMLQRVAAMGKGRARPSSLVLVPTRELAMQVAEALYRYGQRLKVTVTPIYGGQSFSQQRQVLKRGVDVVVATPGRALDHIKRGTLDLGGIAMLVLDEADEMLDMGFAEDLEAILAQTPAERQTIFFSATLPPHIAGMSRRHLRDPQRVTIGKQALAKGDLPKIRQTAYIMPRVRKLTALGRILDLEDPESTLIFCRTRTEVDQLAVRLTAHGYRCHPLHGGISQDQRSRVIRQLRDGAIDLVVATDVAARGLDIQQLSHVINYDVPATPESYVHRVGRVGRAGREGVAITLADPRESRLLRLFERQVKRKIQIEQVPSVADLRARRLELTRVSLEQVLLDGQLEPYRSVVEMLLGDHDLMDVAMAAVKLAQDAQANDSDDPEAPEEDFVPIAPPATRREQGRQRQRQTHGQSRRSQRGSGMARIYIGAGRQAGVSPRDLVGAIAGESGINGRLIGSIDVADRFSVVELPEEVIRDVLSAMRRTTIKGRKVPIRRFVEH